MCTGESLAYAEDWADQRDFNNVDRKVLFDITFISSYSKNNSYVGWGYNRDHEHKEQINIGLLTSFEGNKPLWYNINPGPIRDANTLDKLVDSLKRVTDDNFTFTGDKGFKY